MAKRRGRNRRSKSRRRGRGSPLRRYAWAIVIALLLLGGYVAWYFLAPVTGGEPQAACAILIDRTASSSGDNTVDEYKSLATRALEGCADEEAVTLVYYFDQDNPGIRPAGGNDARYDLFPPEGRLGSKQTKQVEDALDEARSDIEAVFDEGADAERGSDVLQSLQAASEALQNRANAADVDELFIVVISDGLQTGASLRVDSMVDGGTPASLASDAAELDLIPDLDGVSVTWAGVRSGDPGGEAGGEVEDAFERDVKAFWTKVVEDGGGTLCTYTYDPDVLPVSCQEGD